MNGGIVVAGNNASDIAKALVAASQQENLKAEGRFKILEWADERAYEEAQRLIGSMKPDQIDDEFWARYYGYCRDVHEFKNVGVTAGLHVLLQAAADLSIGAAAKYGGPAASSNKAFLGVGGGRAYATMNGGSAVGATSVTLNAVTQTGTTTTFAANDIAVFEDSTTLDAQGTNVETAIVSSYAANTLTLTLPLRFAHATGTYVVKAGNPAQTDLFATSNKTYKGIDTSFPTEGAVNSKATLTWQATYGTAEAQYGWFEALIAAVPQASSPPNAGSGLSGVTSLPASSILLAASVWYPSPLTKGASIISQQYQFSVS